MKPSRATDMFFVFAVLFVSYGFRRWLKREENGLNKKMFPFSELS